MGHCNGPSGGDLLLEQRDHAAPAVENIAEPNGRKTGFAAAGPLLDHHLGNTLRSPHNTAGVYCFIRGDEDKNPRGAIVSRPGHIGCPENIIFYRLYGIPFHQGDMFVRGGVKDNFGPVYLEYFL